MSRAAHQSTRSRVPVRTSTAPTAAVALSLVGAASLSALAGTAGAASAGPISGGAQAPLAPTLTAWSTSRPTFTEGRTPAQVRVRFAADRGTRGVVHARVLTRDGRRTLFRQTLGTAVANTTTTMRLRRTSRWRPGSYRLRVDVRTDGVTAPRTERTPSWRPVTVRAATRRPAPTGPTPSTGGTLKDAGAAPSRDGYVFPVQGACNFRSSAGQRFGTPRGGGRRHNGHDIGTFQGTPPAVAITSGVVSAVFYDDAGGGWVILIDGDDGFAWGYFHMKTGSMRVRVGERVRAGQHVADVGATGGNYEPHLHLEQRPKPWAANRHRAVDPFPLLSRLPNRCTG